LNKLDENLFISPFSVSLALAMTLTGARNETAIQLKKLLDLNLKDSEISEIYNEYLTTLDVLNSETSILNVANRIYSQNNFKLNQKFENNLVKNFKSEINQIDFSYSADSAETINKWVSNKTNHKINKIIEKSSLNSLTRLILINAIYFKANWQNPFKKELTKNKDFYLSNGLKTKVEMMKIKDKPFKIKINPAGLNAMTCELPYKNNQISMTIILPNKETSIEQLEKSLTLKHLKEIYSSSIPVSANVQVPKFNITFYSDVIF
jgi:serpin B